MRFVETLKAILETLEAIKIKQVAYKMMFFSHSLEQQEKKFVESIFKHRATAACLRITCLLYVRFCLRIVAK